MKIGGGISYISGPMGSGKTLRAVRGITRALCHHEYVVTNVPLKDGWADTIARHVAPYRGKEQRGKIARKLEKFYIFTESLEEATLILTGAEFPGAREGRIKWFWDESHNDLNNRTWQGRGRDEESRISYREDRVDLLEITTQFRKLGIEGYLLSQHTDNTDAQIRRACNFVIKMQNQREQTRLLGMRVTPWPLFLAFWYPANVVIGKSEPLKVERYFLSWHRHIYDTMSLYHGLKDYERKRVALPADGLDVPVGDLLAELDLARRKPTWPRGLHSVPDEPIIGSTERKGAHDVPKIQIPVTSSLVSAEALAAMIEDYHTLADGETATDGETYESRAKANNVASTYLRLMAAKGVKARSRTFELNPGEWVFGILHPTKQEDTTPEPEDDKTSGKQTKAA